MPGIQRPGVLGAGTDMSPPTWPEDDGAQVTAQLEALRAQDAEFNAQAAKINARAEERHSELLAALNRIADQLAAHHALIDDRLGRLAGQ